METVPQIVDMPLMTLLTVALGGAVGAFVKDIMVDGALVLPYQNNGKLYLGFFAGTLIGAFVGIVVDHSFLTAALGGFTGSSILTNLVTSRTPKHTILEIKKESDPDDILSPDISKHVVESDV